MMAFLNIIRASFAIQLRENLTNNTLWFTLLIQPVLFSVLSLGLYQIGGRKDFSAYAIIGVGLIGMWNVNLWTSGFVVFNERRGGTLELLMASPSSLMLILFGKSLSNAIISLGAIGITLLTGALFFQIPIQFTNPPGFLAGLFLTVFSLTMLGLLLATMFVLTRTARNMTQLLNYPIFILSGLTFPLTVLPTWTRPFSWILATTWGNQTLTQAALSSQTELLSYLWLIVLSTAYYFIALFAFRKIEYLARERGGLHLF